MATRRVVPTEKSIPVKDDASSSASKSSSISPAVPASVIYKLLGFTLAMVVAPLGTYYLAVNTIFTGSSTLSGASAAVMANVVLIGYIIAAMKEDQSDRIEAEEKAKKGQ